MNNKNGFSPLIILVGLGIIVTIGSIIGIVFMTQKTPETVTNAQVPLPKKTAASAPQAQQSDLEKEVSAIPDDTIEGDFKTVDSDIQALR